jgi:hypothetical protein
MTFFHDRLAAARSVEVATISGTRSTNIQKRISSRVKSVFPFCRATRMIAFRYLGDPSG